MYKTLQLISHSSPEHARHEAGQWARVLHTTHFSGVIKSEVGVRWKTPAILRSLAKLFPNLVTNIWLLEQRWIFTSKMSTLTIPLSPPIFTNKSFYSFTNRPLIFFRLCALLLLWKISWSIVCWVHNPSYFGAEKKTTHAHERMRRRTDIPGDERYRVETFLVWFRLTKQIRCLKLLVSPVLRVGWLGEASSCAYTGGCVIWASVRWTLRNARTFQRHQRRTFVLHTCSEAGHPARRSANRSRVRWSAPASLGPAKQRKIAAKMFTDEINDSVLSRPKSRIDKVIICWRESSSLASSSCCWNGQIGLRCVCARAQTSTLLSIYSRIKSEKSRSWMKNPQLDCFKMSVKNPQIDLSVGFCVFGEVALITWDKRPHDCLTPMQIPDNAKQLHHVDPLQNRHTFSADDRVWTKKNSAERHGTITNDDSRNTNVHLLRSWGWR